jgi:hypothetical protein
VAVAKRAGSGWPNEGWLQQRRPQGQMGSVAQSVRKYRMGRQANEGLAEATAAVRCSCRERVISRATVVINTKKDRKGRPKEKKISSRQLNSQRRRVPPERY